jgi:hypothetical protein
MAHESMLPHEIEATLTIPHAVHSTVRRKLVELRKMVFNYS